MVRQKTVSIKLWIRHFVNITSPVQLQDGTTYDSLNIIQHIYMKSIVKLC